MANSRIMLVCKHCGKGFCIGKGYYGSYVTANEAMFEQLNDFFEKHEHGCCSDDIDCSDNARNHFAILEEGEALNAPTADVAREIFEEIENMISPMLGLEDDKEYVAILSRNFAELKKKYTEEKK